MVGSCGKEEEFAEETCNRRNSRQREQRKHHCHRKLWIRPVKTVVIVDIFKPGAV